MGKRKAPTAVEGGQLEDVESWSTEGRRWGMLALHLTGVPLQDAAGLMGYSTDAPARRRWRRSRPAETWATPAGRGGRQSWPSPSGSGRRPAGRVW